MTALKSLWFLILAAFHWDKMEQDNNDTPWEPENPLKMDAKEFWTLEAEK